MRTRPLVLTLTAVLAAAGFGALAAQDRSALKVPDGLAFADFQGYETWEPVSVSQTEHSIKIIAGNAVMMRAYRSGLPADGKAFPDGARSVKLEWARVPNPDLTAAGWVAGDLKSVQFMVKDARRFAASGGWAYAKFGNDPASGALTPLGRGVDCGHACHSVVGARDFVFTTYAPR